MDLKGIVLFDIDGVIRDVGGSYRLAVKDTVETFCKWRPSDNQIDSLKSEGEWNNDWDASLELIKRYIQSNNLLIKLPSKKQLIKKFSSFYFGEEANFNEPRQWTGYIRNEPLLVQKSFFEELDKSKIGWGFVSGAEPPSAKFVLETRIGLKNPPLIAMGDAPEKPNPKGLIRLSSKLLSQNLNKNTPKIAYLGDTVADVLTVIQARKECPNQDFISLAIAPPHLHSVGMIKARKVYEQKLSDSGADQILRSTINILDLISNW